MLEQASQPLGIFAIVNAGAGMRSRRGRIDKDLVHDREPRLNLLPLAERKSDRTLITVGRNRRNSEQPIVDVHMLERDRGARCRLTVSPGGIEAVAPPGAIAHGARYRSP